MIALVMTLALCVTIVLCLAVGILAGYFTIFTILSALQPNREQKTAAAGLVPSPGTNG